MTRIKFFFIIVILVGCDSGYDLPQREEESVELGLRDALFLCCLLSCQHTDESENPFFRVLGDESFVESICNKF